MATLIKATETSDEATRKNVLDAILTYNRDDSAATWAVFEWLRGKNVAKSLGQ
jgi:predicted RecB family nuclease